MNPALQTALAGLGTGLGLIVAIGAQNALLLRVGILERTRTVTLGVFICAISDALLIVVGVLGMGAIVTAAPLALVILRYAGAAFLIVYGLLAARRAFRARAMDAADAPPRTRPLVALVAFTWLNPHVYLDTVVLVGGIANQHGDERWWFAAGAVLASFIWFGALGFGARLLRPLFARPVTWRILDALVAVVLVGLGVRLLLDW